MLEEKKARREKKEGNSMNNDLSLMPKADLLLVDDQPNNLRVLTAILVKEGYRIRKALNGELALLACQKILPDLILLDIAMPDLDGYQVCQRLKADQTTREIPIIFISALGDVTDKIKAFDVGGVDYITKPFQAAEVISRIGTHLKMRSLQLKLQEKNLALEAEIEQRKNAQTALQLSEARNLALLNAIPDLMLRIRIDGIFLDYRIAKDMTFSDSNSSFPIPDLSEEKDGFIGKKVFEVLSDDLAVWLMHYVEQTLLTSEINIGEFVQKNPPSIVQTQGEWQIYEARFVKSCEDEVLAIIRNVSDRKLTEALRLKTEAQLSWQKKQLEQTVHDLKLAQTQLVQNEKMVGLGQLVAGIAHEINNPVNFIYGNILYAQTYVKDLLTLVEAYQQNCEPTWNIKKLLEEIDLNFLKNDLDQLFGSMQMGAERIHKMVISLRSFARLDEAKMKPVDIHEGINSTLLLLEYRLKETDQRPAIKVIKNYSFLPKVTCYPSQLNQVFFHLLTNAIDALESRAELEDNPFQYPLKIEIKTAETSQYILIQIKDNGMGIPEATQHHLFDPFFTTKPVGTGTGLGLSISYQIIVQQHQGSISCSSTPGDGAEFTIRIPN